MIQLVKVNRRECKKWWCKKWWTTVDRSSSHLPEKYHRMDPFFKHKQQQRPSIDEAVERGFEVPNHTIKKIRDATPFHCYRRDMFHSLSKFLQETILVTSLVYTGSYIDIMPSVTLRIALYFGDRQYPTSSWISYLNLFYNIFYEHQSYDVMESVGGIFAMIGLLGYSGQPFDSMAIIKFYVLPYLLFLNFWSVLITFLYHTHPHASRYRENLWNFKRNAALTVERSYGTLIDHLYHHILYTHVVQHFFILSHILKE
ncbi:hypothetical protein BDA99DRAFT_537015 [Phascolomyces articulosus]|uniref:Uncharacterized protein n=1 Tax=Phascolomyces articulosus TaxID=60185 RepID=A0AAD5KBG9_9FUNG|nr:hypothetical protein BDA99DRAFT_537015 [Phascolomyces articulosus]